MNLTLSAGIFVQLLALVYWGCNMHSTCVNRTHNPGASLEFNSLAPVYTAPSAVASVPETFAVYLMKPAWETSGKVLVQQNNHPSRPKKHSVPSDFQNVTPENYIVLSDFCWVPPEKGKASRSKSKATYLFYKYPKIIRKTPHIFYNVRPENRNVTCFYYNATQGNHKGLPLFYRVLQKKYMSPFLCLLTGLRWSFPLVHHHSKPYTIPLERHSMIFHGSASNFFRCKYFSGRFREILSISLSSLPLPIDKLYNHIKNYKTPENNTGHLCPIF